MSIVIRDCALPQDGYTCISSVQLFETLIIDSKHILISTNIFTTWALIQAKTRAPTIEQHKYYLKIYSKKYIKWRCITCTDQLILLRRVLEKKAWKENNKLQDIVQEPNPSPPQKKYQAEQRNRTYRSFMKVRLHLKCIMTVVYKWHVYMIIYMFHRIMEDLVELNF